MHEDKYLAFVLDEWSRMRLLQLYPPVHPIVTAHHVTLQFLVTEEGIQRFVGENLLVRVVGHAKNEKVQCVTVSVNGHVGRLDGSMHHITISHAAGITPRESNVLLASQRHLIRSADPQMIVVGGVTFLPKKGP